MGDVIQDGVTQNSNLSKKNAEIDLSMPELYVTDKIWALKTVCIFTMASPRVKTRLMDW